MARLSCAGSVAKHFVPLLSATKDGPQAFVAITSIAAHMRDSAVTPFAYNLSKLGMNRMVEHIAADHREEGIQAFAVHPGAVLTPRKSHARDGLEGLGAGD